MLYFVQKITQQQQTNDRTRSLILVTTTTTTTEGVPGSTRPPPPPPPDTDHSFQSQGKESKQEELKFVRVAPFFDSMLFLHTWPQPNMPRSRQEQEMLGASYEE